MKVVGKAGLDVVAEHPHSPFASRSARFVQLARVHDLTILDAADISDTSQRTVVEDALFDSGRPVLLMPRHGGSVRPRRMAIAWDGSARSARAVKDALPLLVSAEAVVAITVEGEKDLSSMAPGADLATYLARHGIECKLATLAAEARDAAERLRLFIAEEEMEMIVMGAFVHSRFRQAILGGFTQTMLDEPPVPLFMAR
jgi:nucleotide-binding universal stress UspA family protein